MRGEGQHSHQDGKMSFASQEVETPTEQQFKHDLFEKIIPVCQTWTDGFQTELLPRIEQNIAQFTPKQREETKRRLFSILESLKVLTGNKSPTAANENLGDLIRQEIDLFKTKVVPFFEGRKEKFYTESEDTQRRLKERFLRMFNILKSFRISVSEILTEIESQEKEPLQEMKELVEEARRNAAFTIFVSAFGDSIRDWGDGEDRNPEDSGYICQRRNFGKYQGMGAVEESAKVIGGQQIGSVLGHQEDDFLPNSNVLSTDNGSQLKRDIIAYGQLGNKTLRESSSVRNEGSDNLAFFIKMTINSDVRDGKGRPGGFPELTLVGDQKMVNKIIEFLWKNPDKYYQFIGDLFTQEEAPKTKGRIIDKAKLTQEIIFLNAGPLQKARRDGEGGLVSREGRITPKALEDSRFATLTQTKNPR